MSIDSNTHEHEIEHKMNEVLTGDTLANALGFAAFLRANGLIPQWHSGNGWSIGSAGFMLVDGSGQIPGPWTVWFNSCDFDGADAGEELKQTAWAHASVCGHFSSGGKDCGCGDQPGFHRTIFGREFDNICHSPLMFTDPDGETLENAKRLMLMLKRDSAS